MKTTERKIKETIEFEPTPTDSTFSAISKAREWCHENGFSVGSMARDMPIAIMSGDYQIAKWYNLSHQEREEIHGVILSNDFREGKCKIIIYER